MLRSSARLFVFGTEILLLGCKHKNAPVEAKSTDMYKQLKNFSPELIMVEILDGYHLESLTYGNTDVAIINEYTSNHDVRLNKYDLDITQYEMTLPNKLSTVPEKRREQVKNYSRDTFRKMYEIREDKGAVEFLDVLNQHNRIAIHCGNAHFPAYKEHLEYLSEY